MARDDRRGDPGRRLALLRITAFLALIAILFAALTLTGSFPNADEVRDAGEDLGAGAKFAFIPAFVLLNFVITWPILAGGAGLLFGTAAGTPLALAGVVGAALAQMAVGRYLAGEQVGKLLPKRAERVERFLERKGAIAVMETRIVPLLPYGAVNYAGGLTRLRFRDMALGTVIGAAPKVFAYAALGGSLTNLGAPEAKIAIALMVVVALVGLVLARREVTAA